MAVEFLPYRQAFRKIKDLSTIKFSTARSRTFLTLVTTRSWNSNLDRRICIRPHELAASTTKCRKTSACDQEVHPLAQKKRVGHAFFGKKARRFASNNSLKDNQIHSKPQKNGAFPATDSCFQQASQRIFWRAVAWKPQGFCLFTSRFHCFSCRMH